MTTTAAVIIGNGTTRSAYSDLNKFRRFGKLYACNAAYRDFDPDYLIAIDDAIIQEIAASTFPKHKFIVPPPDDHYESAAYSPMRRRANAGMLAMAEAIRHGNDTLYCVGFDFIIADDGLNHANVYDNTFGYGPETRASVADCLNRCSYLDWFAQTHYNVMFVFIFPKFGLPFRKFRSQNIKAVVITP